MIALVMLTARQDNSTRQAFGQADNMPITFFSVASVKLLFPL